ncbi:hypothetical protein FB45DRAFT_904492 [Roridomyces roridus]|uniref:Uncharacterized protein n=1 Tax=Roridomyces roridus TaxID=1738132 RepID=A0AAD7FRR1_9AGAR|nr:hypothetical protein FB45DRAFT_904492 [Roridomyces roridus]
MPALRSSKQRVPLRELPLERFLPPDPNLPTRPNKRVYSPGGPIPFSPTKRRILAEEGIIVSSGDITKPARIRALPVNRDGTPAKKVDFGPRSPPSASQPYPARVTRSQTKSDASKGTSLSPTPAPRVVTTVIKVPRELPPPVDPQSIHYPGFVVYQDPYILVGSVMLPEAPLSPQKENLPARRKSRKSSVASPSVNSASTSATHSPCTPKVERSNHSATPTPRRTAVVLTRDTRLTPKLRHSERLELRKRLEDEVDDVSGDDDEDSALM